MVRAAARGTTRAATARVPVNPPVPSLRAARARAGKAKTTRRLGRVAAASTSSVTVTCPVCTEAVYEWKPEGPATGNGGDASFGAEDKEPVIACGACRKRFRSAGFLDMTILPQSALKGGGLHRQGMNRPCFTITGGFAIRSGARHACADT